MTARPWLTVVVPVAGNAPDRVAAAGRLRTSLGDGVEVVALVEPGAEPPASDDVRIVPGEAVAQTAWSVGPAVAGADLVVLLDHRGAVDAAVVRRLLERREPGVRVLDLAAPGFAGRAAARAGRPRTVARLIDRSAPGGGRRLVDAPPPLVRWTQRTALLAGLALYGLVCGVVAGVLVAGHEEPPMLSQRATQLDETIAYAKQGGPLLAGVDSATGVLRAYPVADDPGFFVLLPSLAKVVAEDDPGDLLILVFAGLVGSALALYPLVLYGLLDSVLAGLVGPWLGYAAFADLVDHEFYGAAGWMPMLALPLLALVWRRWGRYGPHALVGLCVLASAASALRSHAGLAVPLAAAGILLACEPAWRRRGVWLAAIVAGYLVVQPLTIHALQEHRDRQLPELVFSEGFETNHGLWHNLYIGLGFVPNDHGIRWFDGVGAAEAEERRPGVPYASKEYFGLLRDAFFDVARDDPGFVVRALTLKGALAVDDAARRFPWAVLLVPLLALVGPYRRTMRAALLVAAPFAVVGLANPVVGIPDAGYEAGLTATFGAMQVLGVAGVIAVVAGMVRRGRLPERPTLRPPRRRATAIAAAVVTLVVATAALANEARPLRLYANAQFPTAAAAVAGDEVAAWSFPGGVPPDWRSTTDRLASRDGALDLTTTPVGSGYQLEGPRLELPAGEYAAVADVDVRSNGLQLGALDAGRDVWIRTEQFASKQRAEADERLVLRFELTEPSPVRILLANWAEDGTRSRWTVRSVSLVRLPEGTVGGG